MTTKEMARIYKALSNENRLEIFLNIMKNQEHSFEDAGCECDCFVSKIMEQLGIGAPTISHHLKELADAGLILTSREGKFLKATVNKEVVEQLKNAF